MFTEVTLACRYVAVHGLSLETLWITPQLVQPPSAAQQQPPVTVVLGSGRHLAMSS